MKIYFVTGNEKKAREVAMIMPDIERISLDLPEIQSLDPREVLSAKLDSAHQIEPDKALAVEDVTYSIQGIGGLPGTLIKWFMEAIGATGLYEMVKEKDRATFAAANLGLILPSGEKLYFIGEVKGMTVKPDCNEGYHFDSIFIPEGESKRYSEMTTEQKNAISHRKLAWQKLQAYTRLL